jgi:hypothetical protein
MFQNILKTKKEKKMLNGSAHVARQRGKEEETARHNVS